MARPRYYKIRVQGAFTVEGDTPTRSLRIKYRPSAGTTIDLVPLYPADYIGTGEWQAFHHVGPNKSTQGPLHWLFRFAVARQETRTRRLGGSGTVITLYDPFANFAQIAPTSRITHRDTTLIEEVIFVADTLGLDAANVALPEINIPRIDYLPQNSYWQTLGPYLNPFEPIFIVNPASTGGGEFIIIPTIFELDISGTGIERKDLKSVDLSLSQRDVINQTKLIIHRRRGEKNTGTATGVQERRVPRSANGDGSSSENWERYVEVDESGGLGEDEPGVSTEKHEVIVGHGYMHWSSQGLPIRKDVSETEYEENYTLPVRQTRTISGRVNLPIVGQVYREEAFEEVTDTTWIPWDADDDHPYTWTMTKQRTERSGYYLVNEKVPIDVATANNSVDTTTDSSQTYARGLHTVIETVYQAIAGDSMVMQKTTTYNTLYTPHRVIGDPEVSFVGRNTITLSARPKTWRITGNLDLGPRPEVTFDGTLFGYELSVRIIEAIHWRAGQTVVTGTIEPLVPDLIRYRLGQGVAITDAAELDIPGFYLITGVDWDVDGVTQDGAQEFRLAQRVHVLGFPDE
jgi:hypothetical protein